MSQYVSTSVARVLERLVEENRELQARQSHGQALANVLSPYLGDITQLLNHPNSNFDAPVAAPASSPGVGGLQSGVAHSELERVIAVLTQEFLQQEAAERARQAMQQSQKDLAQHCIASLLVAAQMQQQQEQVTQQVAPTAAISDQVVTILESRQPVAEAKSLGVVSQVTHEEPPQSDMKNVPLKKRSTRKKDAAKPAKKKSVYLKSGLKKKAKIEEEPDALSYPCRCRGLPENHNARTAFIAIPNGVVHGQALRCSHPICRSRGVRFRYCSACRRPVAKRNFSTRHKHTEAELKVNGEDTASSQAPAHSNEGETPP